MNAKPINNFENINWSILIQEIKPVIRKAIYKHVYGIDIETVIELEQEILIKVYNKFSFYKQSHSLNSWVYVISLNHVLDYLRKLKRNCLTDFESTPKIAIFDKHEYKISISQLLNILPDEYRLLLHKKYIEGYKQKEIADQLNLPIGTVSGKIQAGIKLLRVLVKKEGLTMADF